MISTSQAWKNTTWSDQRQQLVTACFGQPQLRATGTHAALVRYVRSGSMRMICPPACLLKYLTSGFKIKMKFHGGWGPIGLCAVSGGTAAVGVGPAVPMRRALLLSSSVAVHPAFLAPLPRISLNWVAEQPVLLLQAPILIVHVKNVHVNKWASAVPLRVQSPA